jgi:hypothetical protein
MRKHHSFLSLLVLGSTSLLITQQQVPPVRVYVEAIHGHRIVPGVDHPIAVPDDPAAHNQQMELAKTFLQRCPDVVPTTNKEKADYVVTLNWTQKTRFFLGGKIIHKPDQVMLTNRDGDILYSSVARSVGGDVEAVCRIINRGGKAPVAANRKEAAPTPVLNSKEDDPPKADGPKPNPQRESGAWLGAESTDAPNVRHNGVTLSGVDRNGPAYDAGLRSGDVILNVAGTYVYTVEDLAAEIQKHQPGSQIEVRYMRGALTTETYVVLGKKAKL